MSGPALDKRRRIGAYADLYVGSEDFEQVLVRARQEFLAELVARYRPATVVEIGCGPRPLFLRVLTGPDRPETLQRWITVEPAAEFAAAARRDSRDLPEVEVVEAFAEDAVDQVAAAGPDADLIICASILHEVPNRAELLGALRRLSGPGTRLHVNVPNALSLHRRLARAMGLIADEHDLSGRNLLLQQATVFDLPRLRSLMAAHGFQVLDAGGMFLKPFTHEQMAAVPFLTPEMLDGLSRLGRELPELAAEIWVDAGVSR